MLSGNNCDNQNPVKTCGAGWNPARRLITGALGRLPTGLQLNKLPHNCNSYFMTVPKFPWDSWKKPYTDREPEVWFHEVFYRDGRPYKAEEVKFIRDITGGR